MRYVVILFSLLMLSIPFLQIASNVRADKTYSSMNCIVIARGKKIYFHYDYAHAYGDGPGIPMTYDKISFRFNPGTCFCIGRKGICRFRGDIEAYTTKGFFIGLVFPVKATGRLVIIGVACKIDVTKHT